MYAVIETGGKQYRVQPGDIIQVEKLEGDVGAAQKFSQVLLVSSGGEGPKVALGKPYLSGGTVEAEIVGQGRGDKILIIKMKRRKQYRRTQGHRQSYTQLLVTSVDSGAGQKLALSADDKKQKMAGFHTQLKPKGLPSTPKTLGSRKRLAAKAAAAKAAQPATAKKATAKATKKTPSATA